MATITEYSRVRAADGTVTWAYLDGEGVRAWDGYCYSVHAQGITEEQVRHARVRVREIEDGDGLVRVEPLTPAAAEGAWELALPHRG